MPSIMRRGGSAAWGHWDTRQAPTETQKSNLEIAQGEFDAFSVDLKQTLEVTIPELEAQLEGRWSAMDTWEGITVGAGLCARPERAERVPARGRGWNPSPTSIDRNIRSGETSNDQKSSRTRTSNAHRQSSLGASTSGRRRGRTHRGTTLPRTDARRRTLRSTHPAWCHRDRRHRRAGSGVRWTLSSRAIGSCA